MTKAKNNPEEIPEEKTTPEVNEFERLLQEAEAKVGEMLAGAEERAKEIIEEAQRQVGDVEETKPNGPTDAEVKRSKEKVPVELFKDTNLYKDDVYVAVNGENIKIQRGKAVEIDKKFAEVLDNSRRQDAAAADLNEELGNDFEQKSTALE